MSELYDVADMLLRHRECGPMASLNIKPYEAVAVAGAYEGATMHFLSRLYDCNVIGFEPQEVHRERAEANLRGREKCIIHPYGLGVRDGFFPMGEVGTDAASFVPDPNDRTHGVGELRDAARCLQAGLALLVLNIEGYEYQLLKHLFRFNILPYNVEHLIIQFHDVDRHVTEYTQVIEFLESAYTFRWHHPQEPHWTWQWWERAK